MVTQDDETVPRCTRDDAHAGYNGLIPMKARVYVSFKSTVLDPQGQTIQHALNGLGHKSIAAVRQGKYFEIEMAPGSVQEQAARENWTRLPARSWRIR